MFKKLKGWFGKATNKKESREKTKTELSNQALAAQLAADNSEVSVPAEAELLTSPATDEPVMVLDANSATDHPAAVPEPEPAPPPPAVEPPADCIAIPGNIVLSLFPPEYLIAPVENLVADYGEQTGFIFARSDLMYGLSAGRLTFSLADVVQKAQLNVFTDEIMEIYGQEIELPLVLVVPLIPPAWFVVGQQDQSKQQIVDEMDDLFTDSMTPEAAEAEPAAEPEPAAKDEPPTEESPGPAPQPEPPEPEAAPAGEAPVPEPAAPPPEPTVQPPALEPVPAPASETPPPPPTLQPPALEPQTPTAAPEPAQPLPAAPAAEAADTGAAPEDISEAVKAYFEVKSLDKAILVKQKLLYSEGVREAAGNVEDWHSQAPNGIDVNRSGVGELCVLEGVGEPLAESIIAYRAQTPFTSLQDLLKVPGLSLSTYQKMTGLGLSIDLMKAELETNNLLNIDSTEVSMAAIADAALAVMQLDAIFISGSDGLVLAQAVVFDQISVFSEGLAAAVPQLFKRAQKLLIQARLPIVTMSTFFVGQHAITCAGAHQIFCACIHRTEYPSGEELKICQNLAHELVWYCSHRATV